MTNTFYDISGKIDPSYIKAILALRTVTAGLNIPFFIVGATARDIILEQIYDKRSPRMTRDIDLAVQIQDWGKFEELANALIATGEFSKGLDTQRFSFGAVRIDIVPFGPIEDKDHRICWPLEHGTAMSALGIEEAFHFAVTVRLSDDPRLDIKISTLPGLTIMKLISWHEAYPHRRKDAEDLLFIITNYERSQNPDRLYGDELPLLQEEGFDTRLASARLLGKDMAAISAPATLARIVDILSEGISDASKYRLIVDMMMSGKDDFANILILVKKLFQGISGDR